MIGLAQTSLRRKLQWIIGVVALCGAVALTFACDGPSTPEPTPVDTPTPTVVATPAVTATAATPEQPPRQRRHPRLPHADSDDCSDPVAHPNRNTCADA